eukprot:CAMPEP_0197022482 /NCGR_PEP_ID=MMETSP1384-20130603/3351_1 /TAXON_ID=29189 /ORGANISM="Ammonia sp." /LENGTH=183 /DNA_ID=CAMNT_0042450537 /DNA_START=79 /DNA_END=627 /DNA_ORIENTATION=+
MKIFKSFKSCGCTKYCTDHEQLLKRSESRKRNARDKRSRSARRPRDTRSKYVYPEFSIYGVAHDHPTSYPLVPEESEQVGEQDTHSTYTSYPVDIDINMDDLKFSDDSDDDSSDDDDEFQEVEIDGVVEDEIASSNQLPSRNNMDNDEMQEGKNDENDDNEKATQAEDEGKKKRSELWYRLFW